MTMTPTRKVETRIDSASAIHAQDLGKAYQLYSKPIHRLWDLILPGKSREVRRFYARFIEAFPGWLYFMSLEDDGLKVIVGCVLGDLTALKRDGSDQVQVSLDGLETLRFVARQLPGLNLMCERAGLTEAEIEALTYRVLAYLGMPVKTSGR